ncbi:unnamed protein product [Leptosia nina]|uniref:Neurotransmitter-gated ion-channel ligand-binding domain-containing protein n=1 Tax=Leptosia nina TaxID=320188 RepID=A0AAV1JK57_9NEOP
MSSFATQLDTLLAEYDREIMPATPVQIKAALDVRHAAVYERTATVRLLADLHLSWEDKRISWNATEWGCDSSLASADRLWLPDVGILSVGTLESEDDNNLRARLSNDGRISWILRLDISSPITLQLTNWPRDQQVVFFKFGSRSHSTDEMQLQISDLQHATVFESGAWELLRVRGTEASWDGSGVERRVVTWSVTLQRRAAAHALAATTVFTASVLLLIAATFLPPATRLPLCAASATTASLWLISALVRIPGASSVPRAMSLLSTTCVCAGVAAACSAMVIRVARCTEPPPQVLRSLVTAASNIIKLTPPEGSQAECSAWAAAAKLLDYLLLALLLFTLTVVVCIYL